ncbi:MAG: hypothetical protein BZ151_04530 [Desulfobacca sp. 4484_104]|nr:MAG: hypothetical protein BZ151_04530 [Desulfobacca sp. 4484_104]RLA89255.1 MAG: hypothetical protein DRG58_05640 [Deltaproteobacteria bacterium]
MSETTAKEKQYLFDKPANIKRFFWIFYFVLVLLLVLDLLLPKHAIFPWEDWPQFYAAFGFVSFVALVLAAKYVLRPLVMRKEEYYDE